MLQGVQDTRRPHALGGADATPRDRRCAPPAHRPHPTNTACTMPRDWMCGHFVIDPIRLFGRGKPGINSGGNINGRLRRTSQLWRSTQGRYCIFAGACIHTYTYKKVRACRHVSRYAPRGLRGGNTSTETNRVGAASLKLKVGTKSWLESGACSRPLLAGECLSWVRRCVLCGGYGVYAYRHMGVPMFMCRSETVSCREMGERTLSELPAAYDL